MSARSLKMLAASSVAIIALIMASLSTVAQDTTIEVGSANLSPAQSEWLPVTVKGIPATSAGLAAYVVLIEFSPQVIQVDAVAGGDFPFNAEPPYSIDNNAGVVGIANFIAVSQGATGDVVVARLQVRAVGNPGQATWLHILPETLELADVNGNDIPATTVDGAVTIPGAPGTTPTFVPPPTPTPVPTSTPTPGVTPTATPTSTSTPTPMPTSGPTQAPTPTPAQTAVPGTTPTPGPTPTQTQLPAATATPEPTEISPPDLGGAALQPLLIMAIAGLGLALLGYGLYLTIRLRRF